MSSETIKGLFIAGSPGTRFSGRAIADAMDIAYGPENAAFQSSSLSSDPPLDYGNEIADFILANEGEKHVLAHSAGGQQLAGGMHVVRERQPDADLSQLTVALIDMPHGPLNLLGGMRQMGEAGTKALDSLTVFGPDASVMTQEESLGGIREVYPHMIRDKSGLIIAGRSQQYNFTGSLKTQTARELGQIDRQLGDAISSGNLGDARELFAKRAKLVGPEVQRVYNGTHPDLPQPRLERGEVPQRWGAKSLASSRRFLPKVFSSKPWNEIAALHRGNEAGQGPRVVTAIPEMSAFTTRADALGFYGTEIGEHTIYLEGLSHPGLALRPGVVSSIRASIIASKPK